MKTEIMLAEELKWKQETADTSCSVRVQLRRRKVSISNTRFSAAQMAKKWVLEVRKIRSGFGFCSGMRHYLLPQKTQCARQWN